MSDIGNCDHALDWATETLMSILVLLLPCLSCHRSSVACLVFLATMLREILRAVGRANDKGNSHPEQIARRFYENP